MYNLSPSINSGLAGDVILPAFTYLIAQGKKGSGLDTICAAYIWETTETDMIGLPRKTFGLTTVPFEKITHTHECTCRSQDPRSTQPLDAMARSRAADS